MKYRNHARVRAATRAGEPVRLCARGQAAPPPTLAGQPAMSFTYPCRTWCSPRSKRFSSHGASDDFPRNPRHVNFGCFLKWSWILC